MIRDPRLASPEAGATTGRPADAASVDTRAGASSAACAAGADPDPNPPRAPRLRAMQVADAGAVHAVEASAYAFPWSRGNFVDSLAAGYPAWVLEAADGQLLGYLVAMGGVDEMHLLNVTVAPGAQGRGHARTLLGGLLARCRDDGAARLWLEVRAGNGRAQAIYTRLGFVPTGRRKGYYPASFGRREDAIVMSLALAESAPGGGEGGDALG